MQYMTSFMRHCETVHQVATAHPGLVAQVGLNDFWLRLSYHDKRQAWRPRFATATGGRMQYVEQPNASARSFIGWMPHPLRQWPAASDKMAFKAHARDHGIATPAACVDPALIAGPFLIKGTQSSFGEGIRGPFLAFDPGDPRQRLGEGEYYENFILGHIVKAWYWGNRCRVAEFRAPPVIVGDGHSTARELIEGLPDLRSTPRDWLGLAQLAAYCGVPDLQSVLPRGKEVLVDFKYASRYERRASGNLNVIDKLMGTPLGEQFAAAGHVCCAAIAGHQRERTLFALDAMVDAQGKAWFLEMNSNPMVHPDIYAHMIGDEMVAAETSLA